MTDPLGLISNSGSVRYTPAQAGSTQQTGQAGVSSFADVLKEQLTQVSELQNKAEQAVEDLTAGKRDDMAQVILAGEKADLAFKALLQVRNQLMDAYEEVKQIRV